MPHPAGRPEHAGRTRGDAPRQERLCPAMLRQDRRGAPPHSFHPSVTCRRARARRGPGPHPRWRRGPEEPRRRGTRGVDPGRRLSTWATSRSARAPAATLCAAAVTGAARRAGMTLRRVDRVTGSDLGLAGLHVLGERVDRHGGPEGLWPDPPPVEQAAALASQAPQAAVLTADDDGDGPARVDLPGQPPLVPRAQPASPTGAPSPSSTRARAWRRGRTPSGCWSAASTPASC